MFKYNNYIPIVHIVTEFIPSPARHHKYGRLPGFCLTLGMVFGRVGS